MDTIPKINIKLATERIDGNLIINDNNQPKFYTPGEEVSSQVGYLRSVNNLSINNILIIHITK